ncbi:MAG: TIGR01777 family oxidoreductase [Acidimicrobiales bacterium]
MDIAITGSTGLIGKALIRRLEAAGHRAIPVVRSTGGDGDVIRWDPAAGTIEATAFEGIDAVVHLAGEPIGARRWNDDVKRAIRDSRVDGTSLLSATLAGLATPPAVLLSGSAIGIYGDRGDEQLTEASPPGDGFLAGVTAEWEAATAPAEEAGIRVVHLRTGIVLSPEGGALAKQLPLFKFGLGGKLGSGRQYWSWISLDDEVAMIEWLLDAEPAGPVNLTAPEPVTNADFTDALGKALGRPTFLPVPSFGPKLVLGGELADELLFTSARVLPEVATKAGYEFTHPTIDAAFAGLLPR